VDDAAHKELGVQLFNRCWELLDKGELTPEEDAELLIDAFTSRYHWGFVGGSEQSIVGDWMISRAAAQVGESHLAVSFARRAYEAAQRVTVPDWLSASVAEGLARAYAVNGDEALRDEWMATADQLAGLIVDDEDRKLIASQLATVPK
jgi:hypothetical protein